MDLHKWHRGKPGMPKLVREGQPGQGSLQGVEGTVQQDLDDARVAAIEEGYLPEDDPNQPDKSDVNALLVKIEEEARGTPVFSEFDRSRVAELGAKAQAEEEKNRLGLKDKTDDEIADIVAKTAR